MHPYQLPAAAKASVAAKLGASHSMTGFTPAKTALLVVDMQNYFMAPGQQLETPVARAIVPNVNRLAAALRAAGGIVVWIRNRTPEGSDEDWPSYSSRYSPEKWSIRDAAMKPDAFGFEFWPELDRRPGDLEAVKTRFSAFIQGSSDLQAQLAPLGVDTVLVTGVATNICCESTARDAMMLNYHVAMISDACAAPTDELHAATLTGFHQFFGDVLETDEAIALLGRKAAAA